MDLVLMSVVVDGVVSVDLLVIVLVIDLLLAFVVVLDRSLGCRWS